MPRFNFAGTSDKESAETTNAPLPVSASDIQDEAIQDEVPAQTLHRADTNAEFISDALSETAQSQEIPSGYVLPHSEPGDGTSGGDIHSGATGIAYPAVEIAPSETSPLSAPDDFSFSDELSLLDTALEPEHETSEFDLDLSDPEIEFDIPDNFDSSSGELPGIHRLSMEDAIPREFREPMPVFEPVAKRNDAANRGGVIDSLLPDDAAVLPPPFRTALATEIRRNTSKIRSLQ